MVEVKSGVAITMGGLASWRTAAPLNGGRHSSSLWYEIVKLNVLAALISIVIGLKKAAKNLLFCSILIHLGQQYLLNKYKRTLIYSNQNSFQRSLPKNFFVIDSH